MLRNRWVQLTAGIVGMVAVTNYQYGWTFFVNPLVGRFGWERDAIQWAFTIFVLTETWLVPVEAYVAERFGLTRMLVLGGFVAALGWSVNAAANSLGLLYLGSALAGMGAGIVYGISIGNALKWFPDRRGLAAGLTSAAFGAGSALTVLPVQLTIARAGYQAAFLWFGIAQGLVVLLTALVLRSPRTEEIPQVGQLKIVQSGRDYTPLEMLRTPVFWFLYGMMTLVTVGGLMVIAQLEPMAKSFKTTTPEVVAASAVALAAPGGTGPLAAAATLTTGGPSVADYPFLIFGFTLTALSLAASLQRVLNGVTRPFFGWVSDHIGREKTMFIAFVVEGFAILLMIQFANDPLLFVLFSGLTLFAWGEIYSLFPALCGDMFGRKYATTNYALLYTAKGTASLLVPLGSYLHSATGSWMPIFGVAVAFDWLVAVLALFVLLPLRRRALPK